jgi:NAD+ kinase
MAREMAIAVHWGRPAAVATASELCTLLAKSGIRCLALKEPESLHIDDCAFVSEEQLRNVECLLVIGGDGTILRSAELARKLTIPLLGVNHGHVGFLAEAEAADLKKIAAALINRNWHTDNRLALDISVTHQGKIIWQSWALNEVSIEKASDARIVELITAVDDRPVSRYAGDGVIISTPTGSTAYAFSAGGPIVWPSVNAVILVPLSAHALFARPLVVAPESLIVVDLISEASAWADSRRGGDLPAGSRVTITGSKSPVQLIRLDNSPFTDRLFSKFNLPTTGWRGSLPSED